MSGLRKIQAQFPEKLDGLFRPYRYKIIRGGRGSAKSWSIAKALLLLGRQRPLRIPCAREFQNSIKESVHQLLEEKIAELELDDFYKVGQTSIQGANGTEFVFKGLRHNVTSIKSFESADILWVEEGQSVSKRSWDIVIPTIRKPGSEIWVSYNPDLETDDTHQRFSVAPPPNALVIEINWRDNPWFPDTLRAELEHLKARDYDAYLNVWEGQCRKQVTNALWHKDALNELRLPRWENEKERQRLISTLRRIVVGVDPSGCSGPEDERSDEIGIVVAGLGADGIGRTLEDCSGRYSPDGWGNAVVDALDRWEADRIVAEKNFGGAMVESTIRTVRKSAPVKLVVASRGKVQRAEPVAALYEQGRIRHVGHFAQLEQQLCQFSSAGYQGKTSPDRADANIWAHTELMIDSAGGLPNLRQL